ncbi:MAG: ChaN family lipoprotein, partial [Flavobacteriales bacterium]|nr:ChaN family lipoprotein [Flavobacteriales bacterium]
GHSNPNLGAAQAVKDAAMAENILNNRQKGIFLHFNGNYHSDHHQGIFWYLQQDSELNIRTISTLSTDRVDFIDEETLKKADYLIVVPETMTKTY